MRQNKVISSLAKDFICERRDKAIKGIVESVAELTFYDQVELIKSFCYLMGKLNVGGGNEAAVTRRIVT